MSYRPLVARPLFWVAAGVVASCMWMHHKHKHLLRADGDAITFQGWCQSRRRALEGAMQAKWRGDAEGEHEREERVMHEWGWGWRSGWPDCRAGRGEWHAQGPASGEPPISPQHPPASSPAYSPPTAVTTVATAVAPVPASTSTSPAPPVKVVQIPEQDARISGFHESGKHITDAVSHCTVLKSVFTHGLPFGRWLKCLKRPSIR